MLPSGTSLTFGITKASLPYSCSTSWGPCTCLQPQVVEAKWLREASLYQNHSPIPCSLRNLLNTVHMADHL